MTSADEQDISPQVAEVVALFRARQAALYKGQFAHEYFYEGRSAPRWLTDAVDTALEDCYVDFVETSESSDSPIKAMLTELGRARWAKLEPRYLHPGQSATRGR